jgi:hypothetical protein
MIYVKTAIVINRPRLAVADYAADPQNATDWYTNIKSVDLLTTPPLRKGSRMVFMVKFMGEELAYTYTVSEYVPGKIMVMEAADGFFPIQTTYLWDSITEQGTKMTLINQGFPQGFSKWMTPVMSFMMKFYNRKDLKKLKRILESTRGNKTQPTASLS